MVKGYYSADDYNARRSIAYLVRRTSKLVTAQIEAIFAEKDVSFVQWVILMNLREGLANTAAEFAQGLCHDSGALTRVIDQLEERGLLSRARSHADRRVVELHLTALGRSTVDALLPQIVELYNGWLERFTREETDTLIALLTKFMAQVAPPKAEG